MMFRFWVSIDTEEYEGADGASWSRELTLLAHSKHLKVAIKSRDQKLSSKVAGQPRSMLDLAFTEARSCING
jgi:hypothetical protein